MLDKYNELRDRWKLLTTEEKKSMLENCAAVFSYHSCKIENDKIQWSDVAGMFDDRMLITKPDPITVAEVVGAYRAYDFFMKSLEKNTALDIDFIKHVHLLLTAGAYDQTRLDKGERPGNFKVGYYVVGPNETGAAPEDVQSELEMLLTEVNESISEENIQTAAAYFHAMFEGIHPFADGNGRTGRLLMNYYFVQHGFPPIIVHEEDRMRYYEALELWNAKEEIGPLKNYLKEQGVRSWLRLDREALRELRRKTRTTRLKDLLDR